MLGWYLVYCTARKEAIAKDFLMQNQINCFLPEIQQEKIKRGRRVVDEIPLFPNYLFVRFDPYQTSLSQIVKTPGVKSFVRTDGEIKPIETAVVVALRQRLESGSSRSELPTAGDKVEILEGPFAYIEAIFSAPDGDNRSLLLLELVGQKSSLRLENQYFRVLSKH